jgi:hypothetical protein
MTPKQVLDAWFTYGEDAAIADAPDGAWQSATELAAFGERAGSDEERDWRALDPRRHGEDPA